MTPVKHDLSILQGKTFEFPIRWEAESVVYKPITGISQAAPCVVTCTGHGVPDGWRVAVVSTQGMTQINASQPPKPSEYVIASVSGADALTLNSVNSSSYGAYKSGGYVQYNAPHSLAGYSARMQVKNKVGGTVLMSLTDSDNTILLDDTSKTIKLDVDASTTAAITWKRGVYDLELVSPGGVVTALLYGIVTVIPEVTT